MKIDCTADLHGSFPELEGGDLLIIAGDLTSNDTVLAWKAFFDWLQKQDYRKKIYIAGNHDNFLVSCLNSTLAKDVYTDLKLDDDTEYLCDSGTEFEGLKIWGSPWSLWFKGINPHCTAFTGREGDLRNKFELIPKDTDILITHSPPLGILDRIHEWGDIDKPLDFGLNSLRQQLYGERIKPRLHVFGHIHENYGHIPKMLDFPGVQFVNAAHMNREYEPVNKPIRIEI
jgi:Icc-related predicted phosphoesterase